MRTLLIAVLVLLATSVCVQAQTPTPPTPIQGIMWMYPDGTHLFIPNTAPAKPPMSQANYTYYPQYQQAYYPQYGYSPYVQQQAYYGQAGGNCANGSCGPQGGFGRGRFRR